MCFIHTSSLHSQPARAHTDVPKITSFPFFLVLPSDTLAQPDFRANAAFLECGEGAKRGRRVFHANFDAIFRRNKSPVQTHFLDFFWGWTGLTFWEFFNAQIEFIYHFLLSLLNLNFVMNEKSQIETADEKNKDGPAPPACCKTIICLIRVTSVRISAAGRSNPILDL